MAASTPRAKATPRRRWMEWLVQRPATLLTFATVIVLLPFIRKPFNLDDPLFIWVAQHIRSHPFDPYGFNVNWYGYDWPLWDITKNPPLASYYLALFGGTFGWTETVLHAALLVPAVAVIVGTYRLARHFCRHPLLVALGVMFTPVFLVSGNTIMCDVLMLACWVWALVFWVEGTERQRPGFFALAVGFMSLAVLVKYFGACVIPLAAMWSLARKRPAKEWLGWLAIPIAVLVTYQIATRALYGHGLFGDAGKYAASGHEFSWLANGNAMLSTLAFTGGCLAMMTFFAPLLWSRQQFLIGAGASLAVAAMLVPAVRNSWPTPPNAAQLAQILFWTAGGIGLIALTLADLRRRRDADALMLACWVVGTFVFTAFFNWIVNARSLLPLVIPVGILVARRIEYRLSAGVKFHPATLLVPGLAGMALALAIAAGDYAQARAPQTAARAVNVAYGADTHRLWFQGHWGFQYYMEKHGATPLDLKHLQLSSGDYIAMPSDNSNVYPLKEPVVELKTFSVPVRSWFSTMNRQTGAGFYASLWGPLPFAVGAVPPQIVTVFAYDPTGEIQKEKAPKAP